MKVRYAQKVFVRHGGDESVVWCPRTGGCTVLGDVQPFLAELGWAWRDADEIRRAVAAKFVCPVEDVEQDFNFVFAELISQGFVDVEHADMTACGEAKAPSGARGGEGNSMGVDEADDASPLGDFCARHGIPVELHIDLTDACTERCVHCYVPKGQKDYLPIDLAEKALEEFRAANGLSVHLTGGEAMMHPAFEQICRKCSALNLNFIIFSNMTLCDEKRIAFFKEVPPQFINVSLYSMKPAEHDAVTQVPGSWERTMAALLKCREAGIPCRIATPVLKENQDALPALKAFADGYRTHLVPSADIIAQADHGCANLAHACSVAEMRKVLARDHGLFLKAYDGVMPLCDAKVCDMGASRLYLNAKGNYYPCDSMHEYVLGNVQENTFEDVWRGEKLEYLRGLKNKDFGMCARCEKRPWCKVCPAANFNATGNLFKHHPGACALAEVVREIHGGK